MTYVLRFRVTRPGSETSGPSQIHMLQNESCQVLCTQTITPDDAKFINSRIREDYAINWLVDGLPAAEMKGDKKTGEVFFDMGFNLGYDEGDYEVMPALHNHYDIVLRSVPPCCHLRETNTPVQIPFSDPGSISYRWCSSVAREVSFYLLCRVVALNAACVPDRSRGGSQEVPADGHADCTLSSSSKLVLSETMNNTVTYTYRVMWNVSESAYMAGCLLANDSGVGIGYPLGHKMGQLPAHLRSRE